MFGISFHLLLLCLVSGFTQCALLGCAMFIFRYHKTYQFQKLFAAVLVLHSFGFFNNFVVASCQHLHFSEFLNTLLIFYDYIIVGGYMMFAVSLVFPNKYTMFQLLVMEIPFACALILFAITKSPLVYPATQIFTLTASLALMVGLLLSINRHTAMLRDNVGDIEHFDLRWSAGLCILLFAIQVLWAFESVSQQTWFSSQQVSRNLLFDSLYCLVSLFFVLLVTWKIARQKVFAVSPEESDTLPSDDKKETGTRTSCTTPRPTYYEALLDKNVEMLIQESKCYLDKSLTLQKLAALLGTNRQYLSSYINQEKQKTFYDYINDFRLEEAKKLLDDRTNGASYSIEEISDRSGFNSYATFLRSFAKKYGQTPSKYLKNKT
ncbi:MAG: AraC family transcriptional regulator [Bacteroidales bacterium]|nr:AraC family transcriptional regulator [Bacteroidales bacterium]